MGAPGSRVDERIDVRGRTAGEASRALVDLVVASGHYRVAAVGPNRFQFVRTYRPTWAVPLGVVLTVLLFGLGIVLFFVKRTETCAAAVIEDRSGVHVRLDGVVVGAVAAQLRHSLGAAVAVPATVVDTFAPVAAPPHPSVPAPPHPPIPVPAPPAPALAAHPGASPYDAPAPPAGPPARPPERLALQFSSGRRHPTATGGVIGRSPVADEDDPPSAELVAVDDPGLSKTHLSYRERSGTVEVRDRHSTNGTVVHVGGVQRVCAPGQWEQLPVGSLVILGDQRAEVVSA